MPAVVPANPPIPYTDRTAVESLLSQVGVLLRADDNQSGDDAAELAALDTVNKAVGVGTARVNLFLGSTYAASDLVRSWTIWEAATLFAARWICQRRGNGVPKPLEDAYKEFVGTEAEPGVLRQLQLGRLTLEDVPRELNSGPAWSVVVVDPTYRGRQIRVQERQSEGTPRERAPARDWFDAYLVEP